MQPFVVFSLPRCRSKWLSLFLQYGPWQCGHEEIRHCRSLDDVASWLAQPFTGTVETTAAHFWRLLPDGVRVVTVRRHVPDVVASLQRAGLTFDEPTMLRTMQRLEHKLDQIERRLPDVLAVRYSDLQEEETCAAVFEYCLGLPHDRAWFAAASPVNLQINLHHLTRYYVAHAPQLEKLAKQAKHRIIASMRPAGAEFDGVTFQSEPFRSFYRDAEPLFREHLVQTEQAPDDHARKNLPLLQALDDIGALQITTARIQGRMFGYLMTIVGPSPDAPDVVQGTHTIFFASQAVRGLGMRLQRAALDALRARGVNEVIMRAGHRGSGPRLGTFYRRLGAEPLGQMYRLGLEEAA